MNVNSNRLGTSSRNLFKCEGECSAGPREGGGTFATPPPPPEEAVSALKNFRTLNDIASMYGNAYSHVP